MALTPRTGVKAHLHFFKDLHTLCEEQRDTPPFPSKSWRRALAVHFWRIAKRQSPITNHESASSRVRLPRTRVSRLAGHWALVADHRPFVTGMSFTTEYLKPATPSRNLLRKPYILWLRDFRSVPDCGCILRTSLKSGFASTNPEARGGQFMQPTSPKLLGAALSAMFAALLFSGVALAQTQDPAGQATPPAPQTTTQDPSAQPAPPQPAPPKAQDKKGQPGQDAPITSPDKVS